VPDPIIVPRAEHQISRRDIDPDSVRDLLLGRRPKDFDIGTDAHPYQIKKLFRNCWIIGRRFRLAHVKFGLKTIEVATFRRIVPESEEVPAEGDAEQPAVVASSPEPETGVPADHGMVHRDNTFGTPEEDAFRRDLTINGLFYDIGTFSVIDYVGGLADLDAQIVRSIGDPRVRFVEDPVRMLRAVVMAARLGFDMDPLVVEAIAEHRGLIAHASPARLLEEYYKILRSGCAEATFRALGRARLLELITPELKNPPEALWDWLAKLDGYRAQFKSAPAELTNTLLIGALVVPAGVLAQQPAVVRHPSPAGGRRRPDPGDRLTFGILPIARKDVERLRHLVQMLPRLEDPALPPRLARGITQRPTFADALVWLQIFGESPDAVVRWKHAAEQHQASGEGAHSGGDAPGSGDVPRARRRRRRRRGRRRGPGGDGGPAPSASS
jgi:poly(A) polymerase